MPKTNQEIIDAIAGDAYEGTRSDIDVSEYCVDVSDAVTHMLSEHVEVVPSTKEMTDDEAHVHSVLCNDYLGFYIICHSYDLGGSRVDYCMSHVYEALMGYEVVDISGTSEMLEEIQPAMQYALYPDRIYSELASIGIA